MHRQADDLRESRFESVEPTRLHGSGCAFRISSHKLPEIALGYRWMRKIGASKFDGNAPMRSFGPLAGGHTLADHLQRIMSGWAGR